MRQPCGQLRAAASIGNPHLGLALGELILKMSHSEIRELLLRHLPSVLSYLLVERRLEREGFENQRKTAE